MAVSTVVIAGSRVGIVGLEDVFAQVSAATPQDAEQVKDLILDKVRVTNYVPARMENLYREELYEAYLVFTGALPARRPGSSAVEVRLYGAGCSRCEKIDAAVKQILSRHSLRVDYLYLTDLNEIARAGIFATPALMVGTNAVVSATVPSEKELEALLLKAVETAKSDKA